MAWVFLLIAGLLETGWAVGLKASSDRPSLLIMLGTATLLVASMAFLALSLRGLPLGVAYPVWTGIGSVGSVVLSTLLFREDLHLGGVAGVALICVGVLLIGLKSH